jgi:hypothetical protein
MILSSIAEGILNGNCTIKIEPLTNFHSEPLGEESYFAF